MLLTALARGSIAAMAATLLTAGCTTGADDSAVTRLVIIEEPTDQSATVAVTPTSTPETLAAAADIETAADSDEVSSSNDGPIWVLLPTVTPDRWETADRRYFRERLLAEGFVDGVDFTIVNAEGDPELQLEQADQAIEAGASVIALTSVDLATGAAIIDSAREAGVAVVEYDRFNTGSSGGDVYVSFDNVRVGGVMADVLEPAIEALDVEVPRVVMLNGSDQDNNAFLFRDGYNAVVDIRAGAGDWELVGDDFVPGWDNGEAASIFEQMLADNDVDAVFAANDGLAQSVIEVLEAAGIDPTGVPLSGQDASVAGVQNVLLGRQSMTVYKPIRSEAEVAVRAALALRDGRDVTTLDGDFAVIGIAADGTPTASPTGEGVVPYIALSPVAVTADNVAETVIADGFRTVEELCSPAVADVATELCG